MYKASVIALTMKTLLTFIILSACASVSAANFSLANTLKGSNSLQGKAENGKYLYVTASPKIYSIGDQAGRFPAVGFHIPGEMGGIWMHPIKLFDGFSFNIDGRELAVADKFVSYPCASQFVYDCGKITVTRTDFAIDDLPVVVSELEIRNTAKHPLKIAISSKLRSNLSPTWLSERIGIVDGRDVRQPSNGNSLLVKDKNNNWFAGAMLSGVEKIGIKDGKSEKLKSDYVLSGVVAVPANGASTLRLYVAGSISSSSEVSKNIDYASNNIQRLFEKKLQRYREIDNTASISIPDKRLQDAYEWGKYSTDWLVRDIPSLGRGLSAGLPDYPWFFSNDQSTTFNAVVGTMDAGLMKESLRILIDRSNRFNNNSGRIIHEMSSNGQVYDKGRMEESQELVHAAWTVYKWTGDRRFLSEVWPQALKIYDFLMSNDKDRDLFVEGYGGVEIEGLNDEMFDVACHTAEFFRDMHEMAAEMGDQVRSAEFLEKADTLSSRINRLWWCSSENRYYDMLTDSATALKLIDKALAQWTSDTRNRWAKLRLSALKQEILQGKHRGKGFNIFYNPSTVALTTGIADTTKARAYLSSVPFFCNKFGLYISGISRPDDIRLEEGSVASRLQGEFNYREAIMVGATSNLAIAQCKYNSPDSAMTYIGKILNNFGFATPGTTYEVSPDYGMFVQAWNVSGINVPLVQHFFGISPFASQRRITFRPSMPSHWNDASIKNVLVGSNKISMDYKKRGRNVCCALRSNEDGWRFPFVLPSGARALAVNGKAVEGGVSVVELQGNENTIEYEL